MSTFAVRYTQELFAPVTVRTPSGGSTTAIQASPGASVLIRRSSDAAAATVYADRTKATTVVNPIPTGVPEGSIGVSIFGNVNVFLDPDDLYETMVTVGGTTTGPFPLPTMPQDPLEPIDAGAVSEAMLAFGIATQAELEAVAAAKQDVIESGTFAETPDGEPAVALVLDGPPAAIETAINFLTSPTIAGAAVPLNAAGTPFSHAGFTATNVEAAIAEVADNVVAASDLPSAVAVTADDVLIITDDPGGTTPTTKQVTAAVLRTFVLASPASRAVNITFLAVSAAVTWTDQPAAVTDFAGATRLRTRYDLTNMTQARVVGRNSGAGATGSKVAAQYSVDGGSTWVYLDGSVGTSTTGTPAAPIDVANKDLDSGWVTIAAGGRADVILKIVGYGGDAAADPSFSHVALQVR